MTKIENSQVEEMARKICPLSADISCEECVACNWCTIKKHSRQVLEAGYVKRDDVVEEIFADLNALIEEHKTARYSSKGSHVGTCVQFGLLKNELEKLRKKYQEERV